MFSLIQPSNFMPDQILNSDHARQLSDSTYENMAYLVYYYLYCHNAIAVRHALDGAATAQDPKKD